MSLIEPFKKFGEGYYRIILALWGLTPIIVALAIYRPGPYYSYEKEAVIAALVSIPLYYLCARVVVWIFEGFKAK